MSIARVLISTALLLASAFPARAQGARVYGTVTDQEGNALEGVVVSLTDPGGDYRRRSLETNADGEWGVLGLEGAMWDIDFALEGFVPRPISVRIHGGMKKLDIQLERAGPPLEVLAALDRGNDAYEAGDFARAQTAYEELLSLAKQHELELPPETIAVLHRQLAFCYHEQGDSERESEHLNKVLEITPDDAVIKALIAMQAIDSGDVDKGVKLLAELEDGAPISAEAYFNVGAQLLNRDRRDEATTYFSKAVALDPDYMQGYFQRGLIHLGNGKTDEAQADFEKVLELASEGPEAETARKALETLEPDPALQ